MLGGKLGDNLGCANVKPFPGDGSAVVPSYFNQTWNGSQTCDIVSWQTGFSIFIPGAYKRCVEFSFGVTPTVIPNILNTSLWSPTTVSQVSAPVMSPIITQSTAPINTTGSKSLTLWRERAREIIVNLGAWLRHTPNYFRNQNIFYKQYSYQSRSDEERLLLDAFWSIISTKTIDTTLAKIHIIITNLSEGLDRTPSSFLDRTTFYKNYGYTNKSATLQWVLDAFWNLVK